MDVESFNVLGDEVLVFQLLGVWSLGFGVRLGSMVSGLGFRVKDQGFEG